MSIQFYDPNQPAYNPNVIVPFNPNQPNPMVLKLLKESDKLPDYQNVNVPFNPLNPTPHQQELNQNLKHQEQQQIPLNPQQPEYTLVNPNQNLSDTLPNTYLTEELKQKIMKIQNAATNVLDDVENTKKNIKTIKTSELMQKFVNWEKKFCDSEQKLPDEGIEKYKFHDCQITDVLKGPRHAFREIKEQNIFRLIFKTIAIAGSIFAAAGYLLLAPKMIAGGVLLAAVGGLAWLINNLFQSNFRKIEIIEEKMNLLVTNTVNALDLLRV